MTFSKGQKIVCVDDSLPSWEVLRDFSSWIVKDQVYTVREYKYISLIGQYGVYLEEIKNEPVFFPELMGKAEPGYKAHRFKPVITEHEYEYSEQEATA